MEIKIDTKHDSKEHIRHMIEFLQRFVSSQDSSYSSSGTDGVMTGLFDAPMMPSAQAEQSASNTAPQQGMFGMFSDDAQPAPTPEPEREESADRDDTIEIVPY